METSTEGKVAKMGTKVAWANESSPPRNEVGSNPKISSPPTGADVTTPDGHNGDARARHGHSRSTAPRQVLLIEDDDVAGEMLCSGLQSQGVVCTWVKSVDDARHALEKRTFDAVVTDIMLGQDAPSGLDLVKELQPSGAPVLVITAFADMARVKDALNHGATYLLEKPFRAEDLGRALASVWEEPKGLGHFVERALDRAELTAKERDVARLLLKGLSTKEMAGVTGNTEKTLKHHIASIFHKFGVASRAELFHCIFPT